MGTKGFYIYGLRFIYKILADEGNEKISADYLN